MNAWGIWGLLGTLAILVEALVRLVPRALGPILDESTLEPGQIAAYIVAPCALAYLEGYRGFQRSFVPRAVARAMSLSSEPWWAKAFAPLFCMALIGARPHRLIVNWLLVGFIVGLIILVSKMADPWRAIVDASVVAGLGWGTVALAVIAIRSGLRRTPPDVDLERSTSSS